MIMIILKKMEEINEKISRDYHKDHSAPREKKTKKKKKKKKKQKKWNSNMWTQEQTDSSTAKCSPREVITLLGSSTATSFLFTSQSDHIAGQQHSDKLPLPLVKWSHCWTEQN